MKFRKMLALFMALSMVMTLFGGFAITTEAASMSESTFFAKLNYSAYPGLSAVKAAVDKGDYEAAKAELLKYYQSRKRSGGISAMAITEANENIGIANLALDNILTGPYEFDVQVGMISVEGIGEENAAEYEADLTKKVSAELNNKAVAFMFMERQKQQFPVYIYTKESGFAPTLTIETEEGETYVLNPSDDSYIHSNEKTLSHGSEATMVVKEQSDSPSEAYGTQTRRGYIRFDLSEAANKTVKKAVLKVRAYVSGDCTTGGKDVHIISIGDTAWNEGALSWSNIGSSIFSWQTDPTGPPWSQPNGADGEYTNVTSRFWFGRPMAYEYLKYVSDPEGYPEGQQYGEKLLFLMNAFANKKNYGFNRTLETGERLSCWVDIVDALVDTPAMTPDYFFNIMSFIWGDCNYLNGLNIADGGPWWSNWRIVANAGFFKGTEYFPEFNDYSNFRNKVEGNVEYTLELLYNKDMSFTEAGPAYAQWCAKLFGDCAIMAQRGGNPMSSSFITKLTYATRYALESFFPDGYDSNVGDSNYRDKMPEFKALAEIINDEELAAYISGDGGYKENYVSFYNDSNSLYVRNSWDPNDAVYASLVNNPNDGHYHPDSNQVLMYAYGQPLIVDSGRYGYSATNSIYDELRYASAHNTVEAVGTSMGKHTESAEKFSVMEKMGDNLVFATTAQHGYPNTTHTRNMLYLGPFAIVTDYVKGNTSRTYRQNWHFMPSNNAAAEGNTITTNFYNKANIVVANGDSSASAAVRDGYFSADYGLVAKSEYASFEKIGSEVKFATVLYPTQPGQTAEVTATDISASNNSTALEFNADGLKGTLYVKNNDNADGKFGAYETDAKAALVTNKATMLVGGTKVTGGNIEIISDNVVDSVIAGNGVRGLLAISGDSLVPVTDKSKAIKIKADGINVVELNGEVVDFETDGEYIYAAGLASVTTIENIGEIKAGKDGFVKQDGTNEGAVSSDRDKIQAAISGWAARNAYAAFDLTDYVGKFNKAVLKMNVVEAASGGKIDFYWLDYGTWTRDSLSFVVDSSKMPTNTTSNGATFTGYSYRFDGNVSGIGVGQTFEVDMTNALNEYLANGGSPKFTLAMLSETGSTKFASINHASLAGPTIVLTNEVTEGVEKVTKVNITLVNDKGEEIGSDVVTDVTAGQLYTYDAPKFIGNYALDRNSNLGVMVKEGENYITVTYVPAITVNAKYVCGNEVVKTEEVGISAPDSIFAYEPGMVVRTENGDYLVNTEESVLSVNITEDGENTITVALDKITIFGDNLVPDGSFEGGSLDSSVWKRWNGSSMVNDIKWSIDSANAQSGNNSLMCVEGGGGTSTGNIVGQFPLPDVKAGKTYILSMWIYSSNGSLTLTTGLSKNAAQQEVDISCGGLGNTGTDPVSCNISFEANKWVNLSYVLTANSASKCAEIYARWGSPNDTRIDNIELYEFEYDTIADVTINYVDSDGKEIADSKVVKAEIGTTFDASAYELPTMWKRSGVLSVLDAEKTGATTIEVQKGENTINLVYSEQEYDGVVLDLSFDDEETGFEGGLGKAQIKGSAPLVDGVKGKAVSLTSSNFLNVVNKDGGSLLTGMDEITITFMSKVNTTGASWDFFAASNTNAQSYENEHYLGFLEKDNNITIERYNGGPRAATVNAASTQEWKEIAVVVEKGKTTLYIDGVKAGEQASSYLLSDILGSNSVFQIGKANWNSGEYFDGMIDEFKIYDRALTADEIANLNKENFTFDGTTAAVSGVEGYIIVVAQYDSEGRMVDVKTSKEATLTVTKAESAVKAVAFLWNGISEMEPVAEAIEVDLK